MKTSTDVKGGFFRFAVKKNSPISMISMEGATIDFSDIDLLCRKMRQIINVDEDLHGVVYGLLSENDCVFIDVTVSYDSEFKFGPIGDEDINT